MSNRNYKAMGAVKFQGCVENIASLDEEDQAKVRALAAERGITVPDGPVANPAPLIPSGRTKATTLASEMLPMLCGKSYDVVPTLAQSYPCEPKLDGWRGVVYSDGELVRVFGGRNGSEYTGRVPYIEATLADLLPPDTVVDGELVSPHDWGAVQSVMTTQQPHRPTLASPALHYYIFDVLRWQGEDLRRRPWVERRGYVETVRGKHVTPTMLVPPTPKSLETVLELGFEGLVVKAPQSRYTNGRSSQWGKIKPPNKGFADATIIGFEPGERGGQLDGKVGAFKVRLEKTGAETTVKCGRMVVHDDATAHPDKYLGLPIEIKHWGWTEKGKVRHPMVSRIRTDLPVSV